MAIYLGNTKISGSGVQVDDTLSNSSTNPVQNKVITNALSNLGYEWQKPSDWPDMRSGALTNSVYLLVGHSADYTTYPTFSIKAEISSSGTYDIFVDGIKQASAVASGTATTLTWSTLALTSGINVTTPTSLVAHIVRIAPTSISDTITSLIGGYADQGTLWAYVTASNAIRYTYTFQNNKVLQAITTPTGELLVDWYQNAFDRASDLKELPIINCSSTGTYYDTGAFYGTSLKKVTIKNAQISYSNDAFRNMPNLEEIVLINSKIQFDDNSFSGSSKLKSLPIMWLSNSHTFNIVATGLTGLEDTYLDLSGDNGCLALFMLYGTSSERVDGLKRITFSTSSPFSSGYIPQIDISYTGLDRLALVNMFNSLPTVTNSQVCNITGCTGAADLTASDLAIATNKGWTLLT